MHKYSIIIDYLNGKKRTNEIKTKLFFPLLDLNTKGGNRFGILESITIKISKANRSDNFILVPSLSEIDKQLEDQIKISWFVAYGYVKNKKKNLAAYHEVIIQFDRRIGHYEGNSLGAVLTINFIIELLKFYNADYLFNIKPETALTGSIDSDGKINSITDGIIKDKVEKVFYSSISNFIIPDVNRIAAQEKLKELKEEYSKRELNLIPINNLDDLLDRRNLIDIRKQNPIVRSAKFAKKHWGVSLLIMLLLLFISYFYSKEYDDNPAILENVAQTLCVKNKAGKLLWTKAVYYYGHSIFQEDYLKYFQRIIDLDDDGANEVILCQEILENNKEIGRVACFDKKGNLIWKYLFKDSVATKSEVLNPLYRINYVIDLYKEEKKYILLLVSSNAESFASAVFKLDAATGKRLSGTLWNAGHFNNGMIRDIDKDGEMELLMTFNNNSYERSGILAVELNKLAGTSPTTRTEDYHLLNNKIAEYISYILIPNTDYNRYIHNRMNYIVSGSLVDFQDEKMIQFSTLEDINKGNIGFINYKLSYNLKDFEVVINSEFRVIRDTLVARGKLKLPLSDTPEYCNLLKFQILYWNGNSFVKREELE